MANEEENESYFTKYCNFIIIVYIIDAEMGVFQSL